MHDTRLANLLGATVLAVNDLMLTRIREVGTVGTSGAGALVTLATAPGIGVSEVGRRVGVTQSAAVRMVDGLERAGLVRRTRASGRVVGVELTEAGRRAAERILTARAEALRDLVSGLDERERRELTGLTTKLLTRLHGTAGDSNRLCRLCDRVCCTDNAVCPVGQAERDARE
ncbi:MarR family winged helix-turn-helix transcriptional regulator [Nocardia sp. NPDC004068]|uniref:MarR family winged helix-turn-helix transcriptional regulator n=1 Tax=Nocardia sp. NPDC004068 TaxID=3364303 RepID=UPI0036BBE815